ncbi:hypothetical protein MRB53_039209 [Persea americana]|nr:hypothetical protein MRB53_039209 [Persea americana]
MLCRGRSLNSRLFSMESYETVKSVWSQAGYEEQLRLRGSKKVSGTALLEIYHDYFDTTDDRRASIRKSGLDSADLSRIMKFKLARGK